ncbi:FmdB family zinc ribbon protein, partial [Streptomyces olivaceoviridis]
SHPLYLCPTCAHPFQLPRPLPQPPAPERAPGAHDDTVKLLSTVAVGVSNNTSAPAPAPRAGGGGCCGGGCCG